ncbi:MAG TPA: SIMPL domain-containing protein, partial [Sphaerochaeta sp.]|nr:SIMPL domain-containing protein [Sphaerochaeta sp.]
MKQKRTIATILLIGMVALTMISCTSAQGLVRTIEVSGTGEVTLEPDIATFSIQVSEKGETTKEAQREANGKMSALLSTLRANGIAEKDLKTTAITLRPSYIWVENKQVLDGQVASQSLNVTVRDLVKLGSIIDELATVSNISLNSIVLDKEDKSEGMAEARRLAVANARTKADLYALESGTVVSNVVTISEFSTASNPYNPRMKVMAMASEAAYDMAT